MSDHYILEGHEAVPTDLMTWATWLETADRKVAKEERGEGAERILVSTVFLGLDHSWPPDQGEPMIFETMIFGGVHDQSYCERCSTWEQALEQHEKAIYVAWPEQETSK